MFKRLDVSSWTIQGVVCMSEHSKPTANNSDNDEEPESRPSAICNQVGFAGVWSIDEEARVLSAIANLGVGSGEHRKWHFTCEASEEGYTYGAKLIPGGEALSAASLDDLLSMLQVFADRKPDPD